MSAIPKRVCVIGAGISGLTVAYLLKRNGVAVTLLEKRSRAGGNISTLKIDGYLLEEGPNNLLRNPELVRLIRELGIENRVLGARPSAKKRFVLIDGKLQQLPSGPIDFLLGGYFSARAKYALFREPFNRTQSPKGESAAEFFSRRLDEEFVLKGLDPFVSGIYAGDPRRLEMASAFPRLLEMERAHGSLFKGLFKSKREKIDGEFPRSFTFDDGLQVLVDKLISEIGESLQCETTINSFEKSAGGFEIGFNGGVTPFSHVVVTAPAAPSADLLEGLDSELAENLRKVKYPPVSMVFLGFKREAVEFDIDGFGFLVPGGENRSVLGTLWNSSVFSGRTPDGIELLTTFVGGARRPDLSDLSEQELVDLVISELREILGIKGPPEFFHVRKWPKAIPQYDIGHSQIEATLRIKQSEYPGLFFNGNFIDGVSVGDCVANAYRTVSEICS
jgi:protoporphyrinogen/coproporphyrinogen III oxidase